MIALIKEWLRTWLGVTDWEQALKCQNESFCISIAQVKQEQTRLSELTKNLFQLGVDVHFKSPTTVIIVSKVNGGQVKVIDCDVRTISELNTLVFAIKDKYNTKEVVEDVPRFMKGRYSAY